MRRRIALAALCAASLAAAATAARADPYPVVTMRALDKVTTRTAKLEARVGETVRFRTLEITPKVCDKTPPEERPEAAAFLEITETREGRAPVSVFRGWMFASSPGLSPMQHPVYDVWVLDCVAAPEASPGDGADSTSDRASDKAAGSGAE
jgi:hypothetical protein